MFRYVQIYLQLHAVESESIWTSNCHCMFEGSAYSKKYHCDPGTPAKNYWGTGCWFYHQCYLKPYLSWTLPSRSNWLYQISKTLGQITDLTIITLINQEFNLKILFRREFESLLLCHLRDPWRLVFSHSAPCTPSTTYW